MLNKIQSIEDRIIRGGKIEEGEALELMELSGQGVYDLFPSANRLARRAFGIKVELCAIVNAKSGRCKENCAFCAQSAHHKTNAPVYGLLEGEKIEALASESAGFGANRFGIVTSGTRVEEGPELDAIAGAVDNIAKSGKITPCASLGIMTREALKKLKDAGLKGYHHNLETARSFFPQICTTHDYEDDVRTVAVAKELGLYTCSGGIFGLGESNAQRVEMAMTLRDLNVDSVPVNFLVPVQGTAMEGREPLSPLESLKIIAVYRFILPAATVKVCAGRDKNLGDMASWIFYAGANGMMVGNYLTTAGRDPETDLKMLKNLGFEPVFS